MYNRHNEVPVYAYRKREVQAIHYNHVQIALKRLGSEIELPLPGMKTLKLILQKDAWIIIDQALNDLPIAAWTDFEVEGRDSLQASVPCTVRFFHAYASALFNRVLEAMELMLGEQLLEQLEDKGATILPFDREE